MRDRLIKALLIVSALAAVSLPIAGCAPGAGGGSSSTVTIGSEAPDFTLPDLDGKSVSLSDFAGRPILINFWRVNCPPCQEEMPYLQSVYNEQQGSELVMLTINAGENSSLITPFLNSHNLTLPVLLDQDVAVALKYAVPGTPTTFFIDPDGIIKSKVIGPFPNKAAIDSRLSEIMP